MAEIALFFPRGVKCSRSLPNSCRHLAFDLLLPLYAIAVVQICVSPLTLNQIVFAV
jgi:hypothetical protein